MALRDVIAGIVREVFAEEIEKWREGLSVSAEITTGPTGEKVGHHNNQVWLKKVAASDTNETGPLWLADNFDGSNQIGKRVRYGTNIYTGKLEILGQDYTDLGLLTNGGTFSDVSEHANIHEIDTSYNQPFQIHGRDAVSLGVPNFKPLRTSPSAAGGVAVDVSAYEYTYSGTTTVYGGITNVSLSSAIPGASLQRFVAVYLDKATNTIKTSNGSTIAINSGRPPDPTISETNVIISAFVRVYNGQTSIDPINDISDQRDLIGGVVKISNVPYQDADSVGQLTTDDDLALSANVLFEGNMKIGTAGAAGSALHIQNSAGAVALTIDGNDASDRDLVFESDSTPRWIIQTDDATESGSNVGSDLRIVSYNDAGAALNDPVIVAKRSTGDVGIGVNLPAANAKLTVGGTDSDTGAGPNISLFTDGDSYPQMHFIAYAHDDMSIGFDAYRDSSPGNWISSDAGSSFRLHKNSDQLSIDYANIAAGSQISTWSRGLIMDDSGNVTLNGTAFPARLTVDDPSNDSQANIRIRDSLATRYRSDWTMLASGGGAQFNAYDDTGATLLKLNFEGLPLVFNVGASAGNVGIKTSSPGATLHVEQTGTGTTEAVLKLVQANEDEDLMEIEGKSVAANITKTVVDAADVTTATALAYEKVFLRDTNGNITNQVCYRALYTLA